jgi:hypothetical protein
MTVTKFRDEFQNSESRLNQALNDRIDQLFRTLKSTEELLQTTCSTLGKKIEDTKGECLWRIIDAEEMIKSRVTRVQVDTILKDVCD